MRALDLTNQQFGKLIAIEKAPKRNDKYTRWVCKCECGNVVEVRTDYLTSKHTTSCGCIKEKHFGSHSADILNKKFGKLTPIEYDKIKGSYLCQCDCGNMSYVLGYNLTNGNTCSCGCLKSKGEFLINTILNELNIKYQSQYSFEDCRFPDTNRLAYFDYAIFNEQNKLQLLLEYDGIQHEVGWNQDNESLTNIQAHDKFKEYYCLLHNIPLIRISYKDFNKINKEYIIHLLEESAEC